ncbi:MAG TPA: SprT family zinc-dependent metalloprotease [Candidatus Saccharimonadales bacterium]
MKSKEFVLDENTTVKVSKRSSSRSIRLTIAPSGEVRVSIPSWMPFRMGYDFAKSKTAWIIEQKPNQTILTDSQPIGKNHQLKFVPTDSTAITTRLKELEAIVFLPKGTTFDSPQAQVAAKRVAKKALLAQGKALLPIRLKQLAEKYEYSYNEVKVKSLKTRWGSCDSSQNITLNLYLMTLPWELIDYVLLHELNHTQYMHHGPKFWGNLETRLPKTKELRKELKNYKANI